MRRLFRLAVMLIIFLGISNYTHLLDQTKIKPYLDRVTMIIQQPKQRLSINNVSTNNSGDNALPPSDETISSEGNSLTGAQNFDSSDEREQNDKSINTINNEEVTAINETSSDLSGSKKIANLKLQNCISPGGKFVPRNNYIVAYEYRNSATCHRERRYCINGKLDGSYRYDTCYYTDALLQQKNNASLSLSEIKAMKQEYGLVENKGIADQYKDTTIIGKEKSSDTIQGQEAGPGIIVDSTSTPDSSSTVGSSGSQGINGAISANKTSNDPDKHYLGQPVQGIDILPNGQTVLNNNTLKTWSLKKQLVGLPRETFITDRKTLTARSSYERKVCFTPRGTIISNGQFVTAFKSTLSKNGICELETRFCFDGNLQGTYEYPNCRGRYPELVNHPGGIETYNPSSITRGNHQATSPLAWVMSDLEYMPTPSKVDISDPTPSIGSTIGSLWGSIIYHQPDEVDNGETIPEYQFIPYQTPLGYTESLIVRVHDSEEQQPSTVNTPSGSIIYHQPDEVDHGETIPEYQYVTQ